MGYFQICLEWKRTALAKQILAASTTVGGPCATAAVGAAARFIRTGCVCGWTADTGNRCERKKQTCCLLAHDLFPSDGVRANIVPNLSHAQLISCGTKKSFLGVVLDHLSHLASLSLSNGNSLGNNCVLASIKTVVWRECLLFQVLPSAMTPWSDTVSR